jgi:hypothetical protein
VRARVSRGRQQEIRKKQELPMAEELTERDLPRLLANAERQMRLNRKRLGGA